MQEYKKDSGNLEAGADATPPQRYGYGRLVYFIENELQDPIHYQYSASNRSHSDDVLRDETVALIQEGQWNNGKLNGYGRSIDFKGNMYLGQYKDGLKEGYGIFMWINGNIYEGFWKEDK